MIVTVYTNDNSLWLLNGFQYLFKKYWSSDTKVRVVGYSKPNKGLLQKNFYFHSIDRRNYAASEWSTGVIKSLDTFIENGEEFFIFMLEDYWLSETVQQANLSILLEFMKQQPRNVLRLDLTSDRCQHSRYITDRKIIQNDIEVVRTSSNAPYQMSFQAGIWNIKLLREVLRPFESPWQSEIEGSKRLAEAGEKYVVLGTTSPPLRYQPVYRSKRVSVDISKLNNEDQKMIIKRGWV